MLLWVGLLGLFVAGCLAGSYARGFFPNAQTKERLVQEGRRGKQREMLDWLCRYPWVYVRHVHGGCIHARLISDHHGGVLPLLDPDMFQEGDIVFFEPLPYEGTSQGKPQIGGFERWVKVSTNRSLGPREEDDPDQDC